jgi:acetyltransferase-like isoleucine patch superfamily enzyme
VGEINMQTPDIKKNTIREVKFGKNVMVIDPVNLYECEIGDDCFVGPFVEIQKNVRIGDKSRIQSHTFICELVEIGNNCFIAHGVMFINDLFADGIPTVNPTLWKKTKIGNHVSIGSNATILPVVIADHVVIGAGSVVTKDILEPGIYAGNPARKIRDIGAK